jgi:predicted transcriptional regulator
MRRFGINLAPGMERALAYLASNRRSTRDALIEEALLEWVKKNAKDLPPTYRKRLKRKDRAGNDPG